MARTSDGDLPATALPFIFEGIESPNGTIFPDILLDRVMAHLSGAEFKVLAYIVRRTFGFKKDADTISLDQICHGITRRDGSILDEGTGLTRKTAIAALKGLEDKGVIIMHRRSSPTRGSLPSAFALRFRTSAPAPDLGEESRDDWNAVDGDLPHDDWSAAVAARQREAGSQANRAGRARPSQGGEKGNPGGDTIHTPRMENRHSGGVQTTRGRGTNRYPQQTEEQQTEKTTRVVVDQSPPITGVQDGAGQTAVFGANQIETLTLLTAEGVSAARALDLCARFPADVIRRQVEWLDGRRYDDRAACLVAAIEHDYGPPVSSAQRNGAGRTGQSSVPRRRATPGTAGASDATRYSQGRYGVCPACGCSPCDVSCPAPRAS